MFKIVSYTLITLIILFLTACGGSAPVRDIQQKDQSQARATTFDSTALSMMSSTQKINSAEQLLASAQGKSKQQKNTLLSNALLICTHIVSDYHQAGLVRNSGLTDISVEQYKHCLQLIETISPQLDMASLTFEQNNQYRLMSALLSLTNYQPEKTLIELNKDFNSGSPDLWALYYQLQAMTALQSGQREQAAKALINRHRYLITSQEKQHNQKLIWSALSGLNAETISNISSTDNNENIYIGWLELAHILRSSQDPQTQTHAVNFWLQSYPDHQADRQFIDYIIQTRQASLLNLKQVAILLPLEGKYSKPAKAILDGIMASHYKSPLSANIQLRIYNTSQGQSIDTSYQQAINDGADFIIGPLVKGKLEQLAQARQLALPTLALNSLEDAQQHTPDKLFQFGLSPEAAARMVAEKARQEGHYYAAVIAPESAWGKRMNTAFSKHWQLMGGVVSNSIVYQEELHDFSDVIKSMLNIDQSEVRKKEISRTIGRKVEFTPRRRQDIDMIFMAALPRQAKQIPLQITYHYGHDIPVYSTAHIVANYHNSRKNIDMDGVRFFDMPFLLGHTENTISQNSRYPNALYQRLFAMGVDSYQLAPYVNYLYQNPSESFAGDSGQITIDYNGHIIRHSPWATFDQGEIKLLDHES